MDALITGESERIGLSIIDSNDAEHLIEMKKDGEIKFHECEAYADKAANRTPEENEHVEQARRFAQYYVYRERGYDTVRPEIHPERLNAIRLALESMSTETFEARFGDLYRQLRSHYDDSTDREIPIPQDASSPDSVLYRKDIYLEIDPFEAAGEDTVRTLAAEYGIDIDDSQALETPLESLSKIELRAWEQFSDAVATAIEDREFDVTEATSIGAVSELYAAYIDSTGEEHIPESTLEGSKNRPRDALLELPVIDPESLETFHSYVAFNLRCQIRDCYIRMGLQPPEEFRVLGHGRFEATEQYKLLEMFPNYADPNNATLLP